MQQSRRTDRSVIRLDDILRHIRVIIPGMYFVFFVIDRMNQSMAFIDNNGTRVLMEILCVLNILDGIRFFTDRRKAALRAMRRRRMRGVPDMKRIVMNHKGAALRIVFAFLCAVLMLFEPTMSNELFKYALLLLSITSVLSAVI